jgi:hypothetical protein
MWALFVAAAFAAPCDPKPLQAAWADVSPNAAGDRYVELVACDAGAAKAFAPEAFKKVLPGPGGEAAAIAAIKAGAGPTSGGPPCPASGTRAPAPRS